MSEISKTTTSRKQSSTFKRFISAIGVDNLSLLFALVILVFLITVVSSWFGFDSGDKFITWQNLMNSLAQAVVIVGLLVMGETVVIVAGGAGYFGRLDCLDWLCRLGLGADWRGHVWLPGVYPHGQRGRCRACRHIARCDYHDQRLYRHHSAASIPSLPPSGTLAAFAGIAFLLAPGGKPVGVMTQPDFTWMAWPFVGRHGDPGSERLKLDGHPRSDGDPGDHGRLRPCHHELH